MYVVICGPHGVGDQFKPMSGTGRFFIVMLQYAIMPLDNIVSHKITVCNVCVYVQYLN